MRSVLDKGLIERLQKLQNRAARLIMNFKNEHGQSILARASLGWTSLEERRTVMKARLMYKTLNQLAPQRLRNIFQLSDTVNNYNIRGSSTGLSARPSACHESLANQQWNQQLLCVIFEKYWKSPALITGKI